VTSASANTTCTEVTFLGAAGSGELEKKANPSPVSTHDLGKEVQFMSTIVEREVDAEKMSFSAVAVKYKAASVSVLVPSDLALAALIASGPVLGLATYETTYVANYEASISGGIAAMKKQAEAAVKKCPSTQLILSGYSQGAIVAHDAELQLSQNTLNHIAGTLLLADGDRAPNTAAHIFGGASAGGEGIRPYLKRTGKADVQLPATTAEICIEGDLVCSFDWEHLIEAGHGAYIHTHYYKEQEVLLEEAAEWVAEQIRKAPTAYEVSVMRAEPSIYLPLDEHAGSTQAENLGATRGVTPDAGVVSGLLAPAFGAIGATAETGTSALFSGDEVLDAGDPDTGHDVTLEAWIMASQGANEEFGTIIDRDTGYANGDGPRLWNFRICGVHPDHNEPDIGQTGHVQFIGLFGNEDDFSANESIETPTAIDDGQWHMVAVTLNYNQVTNITTMEMVVDGKPTATVEHTGSIADNGVPIGIGGDASVPPPGYSATSSAFSGWLSQVAVFASTLPVATIQKQYRAAKASVT
jgi:hypothetical protein